MTDRTPPSLPGWRTLPFEVDEAEALLARGAALLDGLGEDRILRWYRARSPALVLGRGQGLRPALDAGGRSGDLRVVQRFSGGGAVLLDPGLLSLDVLIPAGDPLLAGDLSAVFDRVGSAWAAALSGLGLQDLSVHRDPGTARRRGTPRQQLLAAVCYATVGRGEVLADGRKLVGLAQRRRRPGALVQCGLLRRWRPAALLAAFGADPDDAEIVASAIGLDDLLDPAPSDSEVMTAVSKQLSGYTETHE